MTHAGLFTEARFFFPFLPADIPPMPIPANLDATQWSSIEPLLAELLHRPVRSAADLEQWALDRGELDAAISQTQANLYISMTCDTDNAAAQEAYSTFIETIPPRLKPANFELDRRYAALADQFAFANHASGRYRVYDQDVRVEIDLFRQENVPLQTQLAKLSQKFEQTAGAQTVNFDGREQTLPQMARYQEDTSRATRENAWRAVAQRRSQDVDAFNDIYDDMIRLRHQVAVNAGFDDYVGYAFKDRHRFDYTPKHCRDFHDACQQAVVPIIHRLEAKRKSRLKAGALRPWDLAVDPLGRAPLRPFSDGADLMKKSVAAFNKLDPRLADMLGALGTGAEARGSRDGANLDLDTRKGKAPGGYQYMRDRDRVPFIFMNAAGLSRDAVTMLHEAGHAFHSVLARNEPLLAYRTAPMEFCEVASMSMELLTLPHLGGDSFYPDETDLARHTRQQLERSISLLPWVATIDAFQLELYARPNHTRAERTKIWLEIESRFGSSCSWTGLETYHENLWQRQSHLFSHPFYYIEYGIAELGSLQLWLISLEQSPKQAIDYYTRALSLGGSKPLPELFRAAGLTFDFSESTVKRLADRVERELEKLPD